MSMRKSSTKTAKLPLKEIKRDLLVAQRDTPIPKLFEIFVAKREHIALVMDEYGSVSGIVTMEDVIETLLGMEIMDESDSVADLQLLARKNWEGRAKRAGVIEEPPKPKPKTENGTPKPPEL